MYQDYNSTLNLPKTAFPMKAGLPKSEPVTLQNWEDEKVYENLMKVNEGKPLFILHDGPPYANGDIHLGHALNKILKDFIVRYKNMAGFKAPYVPGWDTHGLPIEYAVLKDSGEDRANMTPLELRRKCLAYAKKWIAIQKADFIRMGVVGDFANPYVAFDPHLEAKELEVFGEMANKGYIYKGKKAVYWCPHCETALAEAEIEYKDRMSPSIYVKFPAVDLKGLAPEGVPKEKLFAVIWTTTPWTLPSNLMLAVGKDIDYAVMEEDGQKYVLAQALLGRYKKQLEHATQVSTMKGADFVGMAYEPMFPYFKHLKEKGAFRVLSGEFVSTEDGTGIVHIAPGFGQDDFEACRAYDENFPVVCPVDEAGKFTAEVPDYLGKQVFETNEPIMQLLKEKGILGKKEQYTHSYPFCWRTDTPLIYKAMSSWFVKVTDFRDDMVRNNQQITWVPEHIKDGRFGKWLEGARDWSISRNRFWGSPIPVWKSDNP